MATDILEKLHYHSYDMVLIDLGNILKLAFKQIDLFRWIVLNT